eukprot:59113_1
MSTIISEFRWAPCCTVFEYGLLALNTHCSDLKAALTLEAKALYDKGIIPLGDPTKIDLPPETPARPLNIETLPPSMMPKRGKGGTLKNRIALIHSFCHIESFAIDLSWDMLLRYAPSNRHRNTKPMLASQKIDQMIQSLQSNDLTMFDKDWNLNAKQTNHGVILPTEFYEDWFRICVEEALHYQLWSNRLKELGSFYGALPGHDYLWISARATHDDMLSRLAIVHMVLEGRGLDVTPYSMDKLRNANDMKSVSLLQTIYLDEITHVQSGLRWFKYVCDLINVSDPIKHFHNIVKEKFDGHLKPPFNEEARNKAGLTAEWYLPLTKASFQACE